MSQIKVKRVTRESVLKKAMSVVCSDREKQYGSPEDNFDLISSFWYLYLKARRKRNGSDILNGHERSGDDGSLEDCQNCDQGSPRRIHT